MKILRKFLTAPLLAFFLAFTVAGTPDAPATAIVPSSGQAEAASAGFIEVGRSVLGAAIWQGISMTAGWLAGMPWGRWVSQTTAAQGALVRGGQGHLLVLDVHSTSTLYSSAH